MELLDASSRLATAAMLHDLGKLAERARLPFDKQDIELHKQLYCPHFDNHPTHIHAAYTALAISAIEKELPMLVGQDMFPFKSFGDRDADDSIVNAAAKHHRPESFLQWVIAVADRLASGFERDFEKYNADREKNHYRCRLYPLLSQLGQGEQQQPPQMRYRLEPLSVDSLYPAKAQECEPNQDDTAQSEYRALWDYLTTGLTQIPTSHRQQWPLWLDHFDSLWQCTAHAIPSATTQGTRPDVSLYDHAKATAALAVALWRYHHERGDDPAQTQANMKSRADYQEPKFLLVQGDVFGIQNLIFAQGGETKKRAAKLLRGRSFYVSLLAETAALRILDALSLPSTSQIINAAGKFMIVAPNTEPVRQQLAQVRMEINAWFLEHTYGEAGLGLAWTEACCGDFTANHDRVEPPFKALIARLFNELDSLKHQRFGLCSANPPTAIFARYLDDIATAGGICSVNGRLPVDPQASRGGMPLSALSADQIDLGSWLARSDLERLTITRTPLQNKRSLRIPLFGYWLGMVGSEAQSGKLGDLARDGTLRRCWDLSLPSAAAAPLFHGYARRFINGWVPQFSDDDLQYMERYPTELREGWEVGDVKSFEHLACENRYLDQRQDQAEYWSGIQALGVLKGDIDNLGALFESGMQRPSFAKLAGLSRLINQYFTVCLPWLCHSRPALRQTYTVFAGGDDFFLIGPWRGQQDLAAAMQATFADYVGHNPEIHFSAGLTQLKPGYPIQAMADATEEALELAKQRQDDKGESLKNAICIYQQVVGWPEYARLLAFSQRLDELREQYGFSTGFTYRLIELADMAANEQREPAAAMWRSRLAYQIRRNVVDRIRPHNGESREALQQRKHTLQSQLAGDLVGAIKLHQGTIKIALFRHLYMNRD